MKTAAPGKVWNKTKVQGLLRHRSGRYYARYFTGGKEKWVSLKTNLLEIAKARLEADPHGANIRRRRKCLAEAKFGKLTGAAAVEFYKADLARRIGIKPSTRDYWLRNLESVVKSWPQFMEADLRSISEHDCKEWAARQSKVISASYFNNALITVHRLFAVGIREGAIFRDPATGIERKRRPEKDLVLPTKEQFKRFVAEIRNNPHYTAKDAGNLVELLAYTGCRISEALRLEWEDVDFEKKEILVRGDVDTGTKNWEIRRIPLLPVCADLLERIKAERGESEPQGLILRTRQAKDSMTTAASTVGMGRLTHHDLRHFFATVCIESGVDVPTVSRWLGHKDGGALAMKTYGHLRDEHSKFAALKVNFN